MEDLKYELYISAKPQDVFGILVEREGTKQIFHGSVVESTFAVGDVLQYVGPGKNGDRTVHIYGTVLQYEPGRLLSFTHNVGKSYATAADKMESRITILSEAVGGSTKLTLVHDQWPDGDPSHAGSVATWPMILSNVKTLAETGRTLDLGY